MKIKIVNIKYFTLSYHVIYILQMSPDFLSFLIKHVFLKSMINPFRVMFLFISVLSSILLHLQESNEGKQHWHDLD